MSMNFWDLSAQVANSGTLLIKETRTLLGNIFFILIQITLEFSYY